MQIVEAIKNLIIAMKGSGNVKDIATNQIADSIQYMADNWESISANIGGGSGSYELPAASADAIGGVKKAAAVNVVSVADATAAGAEYDQTIAQTAVALANANKAAINSLITNLKSAGVLS